MLGILPVLFFLATVLILLLTRLGQSNPPSQNSWRDDLLDSALLGGVWLVAVTEGLGALHALNRTGLALAWGVPLPVMMSVILKRRAALKNPLRATERLSAPEGAAAGLTGFILLASLLSALLSPPNTSDALIYHLPRQVYWMQHESVAHYATDNVKQLMMPPLAEYAGVNLMILSGSDAWANLVQWFALALTLVVVSRLAAQMGAGRFGQWLAVLFAASVPMSFMQASNTKNDLITSLWACGLASIVLRVRERQRCSLWHAFLAGAALGLLLLTKGTGFVYAAPILLAAASVLARIEKTAAFRALLLAGSCALALNVAFFARNQQLFGSPLGPDLKQFGFPLMNESFSPAAVVSNLVRNVALHAGTPSEHINAVATETLARMHAWMGQPMNDERTTYLKECPFLVFYNPYDEDVTPAPAHLLAAFLLPILAYALRRKIERPFWIFLALPYVSFFLLCFLLKWQPWNARLQLPAFCLLAPAAGLLLSQDGWRKGGLLFTVCSMIALAPALLWNPRSLAGEKSVLRRTETESLFQRHPEDLRPSVEIVREISALHPSSVALKFNDEVEYPLQRMLLYGGAAPRFGSFNARFQPKGQGSEPAPDLLLTFESHALTLTHAASGTQYFLISESGPYDLYVKKGFAPSVVADWGAIPFVGWDSAAGLGPPRGPFPDLNMPVVRLAEGTRTVLVFRAEAPIENLSLRVSCMKQSEAELNVHARLNGVELASHPVPTPLTFVEWELLLPTRAGENELLLEYHGAALGTQPPALLFRRLQILPRKQ